MPNDRTEPPVGAPLREAKQAMRTLVAAARDALDPAWRAQASVRLVERIAALPTFVDAGTVLLTAPFRSEWDASPLVARALAAGKVVALPRVDESSRMLELKRIVDPVRDIVAGYRGLPEPATRCERVATASIDWVLVPGIAFDRMGGRLGYGGGYYDRLLPVLPARAARVAGAFSAQIVDAVPSAPHDITMDTVVTEAEVVLARPRAR
ncbi:MAG: 5-formyltetrahydrofolate cyclo-ligase [Betaproteobacteria bacterium]|nr:5-formyltetrahydrofolate cyclo-ligase [Betaproteobacteria bacterium]